MSKKVIEVVRDDIGRSFKKLRISLTSQCNFACQYCHIPDDAVVKSNKPLNQGSLDPQSFFNIVSDIHAANPLSEIKLTGGEPLLYDGVVELVKKLAILDIPMSMTTNAFFLKQFANELMQYGVQRFNISLDAINESVFKRIVKKDVYAQVFEGIDAVLEKGADVKLNSVIMRGINDLEIQKLMLFSKSRNIEIRFLELMQMGYYYGRDSDYFFGESEILERIQQFIEIRPIGRTENSTSKKWRTTEGQVFGIISNTSSPFCVDCDRLRLDANGKLYGCITSRIGVCYDDFKRNPNSSLQDLLTQKQPVKFVGSPLSMQYLGG